MNLLELTADHIHELAEKHNVIIADGDFLRCFRTEDDGDELRCCPIGLILLDKYGENEAENIITSNGRLSSALECDEDDVCAFWNGFDRNSMPEYYTERQREIYNYAFQLRKELLGA